MPQEPATLHFATAPLPYAIGGSVLLVLVLLVRTCHRATTLPLTLTLTLTLTRCAPATARRTSARARCRSS